MIMRRWYVISMALYILGYMEQVCGMEDKKIEEKKYTVGMKIPNDTYSKKEINPVHMTITYLGIATKEKLQKANFFLSIINEQRPIKVKVGELDIFGTREDPVSVVRLFISNSEIEKLFIKMNQDLGECEPFQKEKLEIPNWHVSVKDSQLKEEFLKLQGKILEGGTLFIKPLGNYDPVKEFE